MFRNKILERIKKGEKALGLFMSDPSEELVEMAGRMGLDFVGFDGQHSPLTPERVGTLCTIADGFDVTPTMRVPDGNESTLLSYLDRGIRGITVPNIQTREEAEKLVKYTYFAPLGLRSSTSYRMVMNQEGKDRNTLFQEVNANLMIVPQLESVTSIRNLDEILQVEGIDYLGGGPEDMAQSMGIPGRHDDPRVTRIYKEMEQKVHAAGKFLAGDYIESVNVFWNVKGALEQLLERHSRRSRMTW